MLYHFSWCWLGLRVFGVLGACDLFGMIAPLHTVHHFDAREHRALKQRAANALLK